jgi:hypothetical protein
VELAAAGLTVAQMAERIQVAERPTLMLTTSHAMTQALGELCKDAVWRTPGEPLGDALSGCLRAGSSLRRVHGLVWMTLGCGGVLW